MWRRPPRRKHRPSYGTEGADTEGRRNLHLCPDRHELVLQRRPPATTTRLPEHGRVPTTDDVQAEAGARGLKLPALASQPQLLVVSTKPGARWHETLIQTFFILLPNSTPPHTHNTTLSGLVSVRRISPFVNIVTTSYSRR